MAINLPIRLLNQMFLVFNGSRQSGPSTKVKTWPEMSFGSLMGGYDCVFEMHLLSESKQSASALPFVLSVGAEGWGPNPPLPLMKVLLVGD